MLILLRRLIALAVVMVIGLAVAAARAAEAEPTGGSVPNPPIVVKPDHPDPNRIGIIARSPGTPGTSGNSTGQPAPDGTCGPECQAAQRALFCPPQFIGCGSTTFGGAVPAPTPGQLAQVAFGEMRLPSPTLRRSPAETLPDGRTYTVVNMYTWFWTAPVTYRSVSKRVQAGAVWVVVTARPVALTFDPGNGDLPVSCTGPGRAWRAGKDGQWDRAPGGCDYRYRQSSLGYPNGQVTAEAGIFWRVSWVGSTGATEVSGSLPDLLTTSSATFAVAEGQAVVRQ